MSILADRLKKKETNQTSTPQSESPVIFGLPETTSDLLRTSLPPIEQPTSILGSRLFEAELTRREIPSYFQQYKKATGQDTSTFFSNPQTEFNLTSNIGDLLKRKNDERVNQELAGIWGGNNPLTRFLIGRGTDPEDLGRDRGYFTEKIPERGLLGFLTGDLLKSDNETAAELYEVFINTGMSPDEAFQKANDSVIEGKAIGLDEFQQEVYQQWDKWEKIGVVLDSAFLGLDVFTLGGSQAVKAGVRTASRSAMQKALQEATKSGDRAAIRDVLIEQYPTIRGSIQLEEMVDVVQNTPDNFSWLQVRSEFRNSRLFKELAETETPTPVTPATEAQRGLFRTGSPNLRTVEGGVESALEARRAITSVLRGEREAERLSNPNVFLSEVRAGSISRQTEISDAVNVFLLGGRSRVGRQVTLSRELAEEGADTMRVSIDDLVRLPDGTFTVVPKAQLGRDLTPGVRAIRDTRQREAVVQREAQEAVRKRLQETVRRVAERKARQEAVERAAREEAARLAQAERLAKAQRAVEVGKEVTRGKISTLQTAVTRAFRAIERQEKQITKAVQRRASLLRASTEKAGLTAGRFVQRLGDFMTVTEKNKLRAGKSLTATERKRIQKRIRGSIDAEINTLRATKADLQTAWREAGETLTKAKTILREADEGKTFLQQAKQTEEVAKKNAQTQKAKAQSVKANNEFTDIFKDNFSSVRETTPATLATPATIPTPSPTQPLRGSGAEIANKVAKGIQAEADEAYKLLGVRGGLKDVMDGTAKIGAEDIAKLSLVHRVAHNVDQLKSAVIRVGKDPEKAYFDFINSNAMDDSMAALFSALIRSDFVATNPSRLNNIIRHFDKFGTRTAQELQARQLVGKMDYPNIVSRMMRHADEVMKKRNINVADEVAKINRALGDEFDNLVAISKADALAQLNKITCKV